uniref:class I SAM-dependent methyltransferase n=1 Tax=Flavobacterium sp. TaxID=239 RepID=UPI0040496249
MKANFDKAATNYDHSFTNTEIGKLQRNAVYKVVSKHLQNTKNILEINCGTGVDAIWLAKKGFRVTATDISTEMISIAKSKKNIENLHFIQADINTISEQFSNKKFDLVFSNFGGLNCLTKVELDKFLSNSINILSEKGKLILVIMPKNTLWEKVYFILKVKLKTAYRRKKDVAIATVDGEKVATYYYNPKDVVNLSKTNYQLIETKPIGFFIPPSYLEPFFKNKKDLLKLLNNLESKIRNWSFLSKYADHYVIILQKK